RFRSGKIGDQHREQILLGREKTSTPWKYLGIRGIVISQLTKRGLAKMTTSSKFAFCHRLLLLAGLATVLCYGQGDRGLITGIVKDSSSAVVTDAAVRALHLSTNVAVTTQTNAEGNYSLRYLLPGAYTVTVNKTGFKEFERTGVMVAVNDRLTLNIAMEV